MTTHLPSLHRRITSLVLFLSTGLLGLSALLWFHSTRQGIHEEVEAASRVASQWVKTLAHSSASHASQGALLLQLGAAGRLRANEIEVLDRTGRRLYASPPSSYKPGRSAPPWFANLMDPRLTPTEFRATGQLIRLTPDPSRAILDAWDELASTGLLALLLLVLLAISLRAALNRILSPLDALASALDTTASGRFDHRLPAQDTRELDKLARRYNAMSEALADSLAENARLQAQQLVENQLNQRLEAERQQIARELHDELGQCLTAVRAISGAIAQRSENEGLAHHHGSAQAILAMTSQMQTGVRLILQRLRQAASEPPLSESLAHQAACWRELHPGTHLRLTMEACPADLPPDYRQCLRRITQEALTNISRHANAQHVDITLQLNGHQLCLFIQDDGQGCKEAPGECQFGLRGMAERLRACRGHFDLQNPPGGGTLIVATLPWPMTATETFHALPQT